MRICVIGNSHLAAIKKAWDRTVQAEFPHVELVFFGAQSPDLSHVEVRDGAIVPTVDRLREMFRYTSGGRECIESGFDRYLIVGCKLSFQRLASGAMEKGASADAGSILKNALAVKFAHMVREISGAPISLLPAPYASGENSLVAYEWSGSEAALAELNPLYLSVLDELGRESGFTPIVQPARTIERVCFTKTKFALNGVNLSRALGRQSADGYHMNMMFGIICLRDVLAGFAGTKPGDKRSATGV